MRFQFVIIFRFMTHPLFLLFLVVGNLLMGNIANVFLSILGWLFINLIFGKSSYLYELLERKRNKPAYFDELAKGESLASIRKFLERKSPMDIYMLLKRKKPEYIRELEEREKPVTLDEMTERLEGKELEYMHEAAERGRPLSVFEILYIESLELAYESMERKKPEYIRELLKGESSESIRKFLEEEKELEKKETEEFRARGKKLASLLFPPEKEDNAKKLPEEYYKLWGGVGEKVEKSTKQIYEEYLKDKEKKKNK